MSEAYRSVLDLTLNVPAGLLIRQVHHWAADVFIASIVLHLIRIFFTGAYRKPRDLNYFIGLTMLMLAHPRGVRRLLAGRRPAVRDGAGDRLLGGDVDPVHRRPAGQPDLGRPVPGQERLLPRLEIVHVLLIPAALAVLITLHLAIIMRQHHSQFPGPGRRERNVVGTPMWPAYALRSIGLLLAVAGVLVPAGRPHPDQPDLAVGPVPPLPVRERRAAGLVHRVADRRAAPDAQLGARDRRPHGDPQPVLGRRGVPAVRVRGHVRLAGHRAPRDGGHSPARPARPAARPADPDRGRAPRSSAGW